MPHYICYHCFAQDHPKERVSHSYTSKRFCGAGGGGVPCSFYRQGKWYREKFGALARLVENNYQQPLAWALSDGGARDGGRGYWVITGKPQGSGSNWLVWYLESSLWSELRKENPPPNLALWNFSISVSDLLLAGDCSLEYIYYK